MSRVEETNAVGSNPMVSVSQPSSSSSEINDASLTESDFFFYPIHLIFFFLFQVFAAPTSSSLIKGISD